MWDVLAGNGDIKKNTSVWWELRERMEVMTEAASIIMER
jgi:hypothetical protein